MPIMQLYDRPSSNCPTFVSVITLQEALKGIMNTKSMNILKTQYTPTVIDM